MGKGFDVGLDIQNDSGQDIRNIVDNGAKADYGGDLANDKGIDLNARTEDISEIEPTENAAGEDLNKYSKEYGYDDYLESGEANNPLTENTEPEPDEYTSGYTNEDIRNSLDGSAVEDVNDELNKYSKYAGDEQLGSVLENFQEDKWSDLSLDEQKQSMTDLADQVAADTGNENPPEIVFRSDMEDGSYGGYNPETNTLEINENMLDDSAEAADTVAHEMWHAHQQQCANDPSNPRAGEYQDGFDNYISPEYDFEGYQNQMVEAEAREYAQGFKDRLTAGA